MRQAHPPTSSSAAAPTPIAIHVVVFRPAKLSSPLLSPLLSLPVSLLLPGAGELEGGGEGVVSASAAPLPVLLLSPPLLLPPSNATACGCGPPGHALM